MVPLNHIMLRMIVLCEFYCSPWSSDGTTTNTCKKDNISDNGIYDSNSASPSTMKRKRSEGGLKDFWLVQTNK